MEFILLLLVVTTSMNSVSSLICQTCKAIDKARCESIQRPRDCDEKQACLILTYTFNNTNRYQKSCSENMSKCAKDCENVKPSISKNCETLCRNKDKTYYQKGRVADMDRYVQSCHDPQSTVRRQRIFVELTGPDEFDLREKALCCTGRDNCNEIHPESKRREKTGSSGSQRTSGSNTFVMGGIVVVFMMTRGWFLM